MALRRRTSRPRIKDVVAEAYARTKEAQGTISRADGVLIKAEIVLDYFIDFLDDTDEEKGDAAFGIIKGAIQAAKDDPDVDFFKMAIKLFAG